MTGNAFIRADENADPQFKEMVVAVNDIIAAYFAAAEKHELCAACLAKLVVQVFEDISKMAPHSDDVGKGNVDQVGNA